MPAILWYHVPYPTLVECTLLPRARNTPPYP